MKFTVDGAEHEFDEERLTFGEARAIEKVTGYPFGGLDQHEGEMVVVQAMIWVALKRDEPTLKFSDLDDRSMGDFAFETEDEDEGEPDPTEGGEHDSTPSSPDAA